MTDNINILFPHKAYVPFDKHFKLSSSRKFRAASHEHTAHHGSSLWTQTPSQSEVRGALLQGRRWAKQSRAEQSKAGRRNPGEQPASLDAREQVRGRSCSSSHNRHLCNHRYLAQPRNPSLCEQRKKRPGYGHGLETPKGSRGCPHGLRPWAGSAAVARAHGFPEQRGSAHAP